MFPYYTDTQFQSQAESQAQIMCMNDEMQLRLTARRTDCNEESSKLAKRGLEWDAMGLRERDRER